MNSHLRSVREDFVLGMFDDISDLIEAEIACDYIGQAERLLGEDLSRIGYAPVAVLAGAVLERSMRNLAQRQEPPIETTKPTSKALTLVGLIDALKPTGVIKETVAKQLRAWAGIRNAAAHGRFEDFSNDDLKRMDHHRSRKPRFARTTRKAMR